MKIIDIATELGIDEMDVRLTISRTNRDYMLVKSLTIEEVILVKRTYCTKFRENEMIRNFYLLFVGLPILISLLWSMMPQPCNQICQQRNKQELWRKYGIK